MRAIPKKGDIHEMFTFLTRLGRLVIGIPIVVAVTSVAGFGALSFVPAASTLPANSLTLASGDPSFGATIAFSATYAPMKWIPEESVSCSVNGKEVYLDVQTFSGASPWTSTWKLWSQTWANGGGGAANCSAALFYYTWKGHTETGVVYLATASFPAT